MEQSPTISKLAQALCRFQDKCHTIEFDSTVKVATGSGQQYSFKYASYPKIIAAIRPLLSENGLSFSQPAEADGSVTTLLMHESGEYLKSSLLIPVPDKDPQKMGSAISYARRYALSAILGLATDEDEDGNLAAGNGIEKKGTAGKVWKEKDKSISDARPWITQRQVEQAIERMEAGEKDVYDKTIKTYRIRRTYRTQLDKVYKYINEHIAEEV
jgi:hypothetical protein